MKTVDFTPVWYQQHLLVRAARRRRMSYLVVLGLMMVVWIGLSQNQLRQIRSALAVSEKSFQQNQEKLEELNSLRKELDQLRRQKKSFEAVSAVFPKRYLLTEISYWLPDGVRLANFKAENLSDARVIKTSSEKKSVGWQNTVGQDAQNSDLKVSFTAESLNEELLTRFVTSLQQSQLFELVEHDATRRVINSPVKQKDVVLFVYGQEHMGP